MSNHFFFFSSRRRHTRSLRDWSSDVCSSDLVSPGNRIPGIPRHHLNAAANYDLTEKITVGAGAVAVSRQFVRGNDNNRHQPDAVNFLGPGEIGGYEIGRASCRERVEIVGVAG